MFGILSPSWVVVILSVLIVILSRVLNRLKENEGPMLGIRSTQTVLVALTGFMVFVIVRKFVG